MISAWILLLGGRAHVSELQMLDIGKAADLEMLCTAARAGAMRGEGSLGDVTRLEIQAHKAVRRLNLPAPDRAAPSPKLHDIVANLQAGDD